MEITSHGGNIYDFAASAPVDFSSNINPFGPPEYALSAARDAITSLARYPDSSQRAIAGAFSAWLGVGADELVFGNGASDLINAVMAALAPSRVVVAYPTFSEYMSSARAMRVPVAGFPSFPERGFAFDVRGMEKTVTAGDMLITCQPNNPTGVVWTADELARLAGACTERGAFLLADECFINLTSPRSPSCLGMIRDFNVVVLRALTKDFSAPGLRVGFAVARPDVVRAIRERLQPWPLNCVGEAFAIACARNPEPFLSESASRLALLRESLSRGLSELGFVPNPGNANFILARGDGVSAGELYDRLLERSLLIRRCANFETLSGEYFRVAVKRAGDNESLLSGLASIVLR
ncbi:MAG: aminotransferase class I/II-fold pyridoxal phosphate-dependent enzyme [Synergistaceae bacterium]|jgi:threonine-phosphate decarboxylase|nr:aminotransferase class I/II-fold pyridoxal phosphate-dependent enzyme [Synergistaceae bacterium]